MVKQPEFTKYLPLEAWFRTRPVRQSPREIGGRLIQFELGDAVAPTHHVST